MSSSPENKNKTYSPPSKDTKYFPTEDDETNARTGRWQTDEHKRFVQGILKYGNDWKKIKECVATRSSAQIRSHAQKYLIKLTKKYQKFFNNVSSKDNKELLKKYLNGMDNEALANLNQDDIEKIILNIFKNSSTKIIHHYDNVDFLVSSKDEHMQLESINSNDSGSNNIAGNERNDNGDNNVIGCNSSCINNELNTKCKCDKKEGDVKGFNCNLFQNEMFIEKIMKDDSTKSVNKKIEELKTLSNIINILNSRKKGNYNTNVNVISTKGNGNEQQQQHHTHKMKDNNSNKIDDNAMLNQNLIKENETLISNITEQQLNMINNTSNSNNNATNTTNSNNINDSLKELNDLSTQLLLQNQTNFLNPFSLLPSFPLSPLSLNLFPQNILTSNTNNLQQLLFLSNNLGLNTLNPFINIDTTSTTTTNTTPISTTNNTLLMLLNYISQMNQSNIDLNLLYQQTLNSLVMPNNTTTNNDNTRNTK